MGGESKQTQHQKSTSEPWLRAQPALGGILHGVEGMIPSASLTPAENNAFATLSSNAESAGRFAPQINSLATDLLGGGTDRTGIAQGAYDRFQGSMTPYTTMDTNPYSNEAFTKFTNFLSGDIMDRIKGQYAGAGYSPVMTGDFSKTVGEGIAKGIAPTWLQASNDLENRKLGAISSRYSGGNTTAGILSGLDQTALGNRQAGVGVAQDALTAQNAPAVQALAIEAQKRGIPLGVLAALAGITTPIAGLGGQQQGTATGTHQMSGAQKFNLIASGLGAMMPKYPMKFG